MLVEMQIEILDGGENLVICRLKQTSAKTQFEFVPRDTEKFKLKHNLNSNLYREIFTKCEFLDFV